MDIRLRLKVLVTLAEEIAIVLIVLLVLPRFGIRIPLPAFISLISGLVVWSVITYRLASRALEKKPLSGLSTMVGSKGRVVTPLAPEGLIKIKDELWEATTVGQRLKVGDEVVVAGQRGLKLVVRKSGHGRLKGRR